MRRAILRLLYTWAIRLTVPFILLRLLWRSRKNPAYRWRWKERFAWFSAPENPGGIWIHAVSLGESVAAIPLIKALKKSHPQLPITVTNMTPTGSEKIQATFGEGVFNVYVPYDLPGVIKRFIKKIQPCLLVIMETELWPNLLHYSRKAQLTILLANGRLAPRSAQRYEKIAPLVRQMLACFNVLAVQTEADKKHFLALGAQPHQIEVTGSIKFDVQVPEDSREKSQQLRQLLGRERLILTIASTHEDEEQQLLTIFPEIKRRFPQVLLVIVPRHPERFKKVMEICKKKNYRVCSRSQGINCSADTDIFVVDTMGELMAFYSATDVAFVGGSLAPIGGHNLLEPAALGKAVITGPNMDNFSAITQLMVEAEAGRQVAHLEQLKGVLLELLGDANLREQMGQKGLQVVAKNQGSLARHLQLIEKYLP
jgi:3-deoxy-D-manno-octulosonic-acid transferase